MLTTEILAPISHNFQCKINNLSVSQRGQKVDVHVLSDDKSYLITYDMQANLFRNLIKFNFSFIKSQFVNDGEAYCGLDRNYFRIFSLSHFSVLFQIDSNGATDFDTVKTRLGCDIALLGGHEMTIIKLQYNGQTDVIKFRVCGSSVATGLKWLSADRLVSTHTSGRVSIYDVVQEKEIVSFIE
jgi:hypothetical protein